MSAQWLQISKYGQEPEPEFGRAIVRDVYVRPPVR